MSENKSEIYDKLTPTRKALVDMVLENLEKGTGLWKQGWKMSGVPESIRGYKYKGINNFILSLVSMSRGYSDNRWVTYKQMSNNDWQFKTDEDGKSLGKNAGVNIEYFRLMDRQTKQPFDEMTLLGMDEDEKYEYKQENVYPLKKHYRVFNGDLIDGIPQKEVIPLDENGKNERAENLLKLWNEEESEIRYGGNHAYYNLTKDYIQVPNRNDFESMQAFYGTTLHEVGHSTGHESRLNRDMGEGFGTPSYATEELRAEIASMFISQDLMIEMQENSVQNNSAYLQSWKSVIEDDPNVLFTAIADADRITKFVLTKEKQNAEKKETEPFAIVTDNNELDEDTFKLFIVGENGQTNSPIDYAFSDKEALVKEFEKLQKLPKWKDKEFKEVSFDDLQKASEQRAEEQSQVVEEKSEVYIKPSELVAMSNPNKIMVDMSDRGVESLTKMSDREVVKQASETKNGDKFLTLYNGGNVLESESKDERSLMSRLAMFVSGDQEQLLRVFKSSGQFREGKGLEYYEKIANQSIAFISKIQKDRMPKTANSNKSFGSKNSKT